MCLDCGCDIPAASHGDARHIVLSELDQVAQASGISTVQAASNIYSTVNRWDSPEWLTILDAPAVSIDLDATLGFTTFALCSAVNAQCGTAYTYFDCTAVDKKGNFADNPEAHNWAQTFLSYQHGSKAATLGFYKSIAPDYAAIAAVRAMYTQGIYVHISTHRDAPLEAMTSWWLAKWQIPYHELHVGDHSKEDLAQQYQAEGKPIVFVDDSPRLPEQLDSYSDASIYLLRRPNTNVADYGENWSVIDTWQPVLELLGVTLNSIDAVPQLSQPIANKMLGDVKAAGICLIAQNTGRILMMQRSLKDDEKKAAGKWEFPGGKCEGDESCWKAALREWQEETGNKLPRGKLADTITAKNGYKVFVYVVPTERGINLNPDVEAMEFTNPDDPTAKQTEVIAWWKPKDAKNSGALRREFKDFDWSKVKDAFKANVVKSFGDPGNTQIRLDHGQFGPAENPHERLVGNVLHTGSIDRAISWLSDGERVDFEQKRMVSTLLHVLAQKAQDAQAAGDKAPNINLEDISVQGTNLFSHPDDIDMPRISMPQFTAPAEDAIPGSPAASMTPDSHGQIDIGPGFEQWLNDQSFSVDHTEEDAQYLHATQNEINGVKVGSLMDNWDASRARGEVFVSSDNYILDGHNAWAAQVGIEFRDDSTVTMGVARVDAPMATLLPLATKYATTMGIPPRGGGETTNKMFEWLKSFGDAGNTQTREEDGTFGDGSDIANDGKSMLHAGESSPIADAFPNHDAYTAAQESWGGVTIDTHSGDIITPTNGYAVTAREPGQDAISIPENATEQDFDKAIAQARDAYPQLIREGMNLGVFHDDDKGTIDIDPTVVVATTHEVDAIVAYNHATGGAYDFSTGNGYWPPGTKPVTKRFGDPGSTQTQGEHGWFTASTNPFPERHTDDQEGHYTPPELTDKERANIDKALTAHGMTMDDVRSNLAAMYQNGSDAVAAQGIDPQQAADWYKYEHDAAMMWVDHGMSDLQAAALVAATTANTKWSETPASGANAGSTTYSNLTAAATCAAFVSDNPQLEITQEDADKINAASPQANALSKDTYGGAPMGDAFIPTLTPGTYTVDQLSDFQAAKYADMSGNGLIPGINLGYPDSLCRGFEIARGDDPTVVLSGPKESSFMNNLAFPEETSTATMDSHMAQGMLAGGTRSDGSTFDGFDAKEAVSFVGGSKTSAAGYITLVNVTKDYASSIGVNPDQAQAMAWMSSGVNTASMKNSKLQAASQITWRPFDNDNDDDISTDALTTPSAAFDLMRKCIVTDKNFALPPWPKTAQKRFGDPGSTQGRDDHGEFTGAAAAKLEAKAISHFGAAEELQGQQFVTPNGTILNLEGDGHDRIKEVTGGSYLTAESRAINAGFLRTSLDTVSGGDLGLVMEFSQPLTDAQMETVLTGVQNAGGVGYVSVDVPTGGVHAVNEQDDASHLLYSEEQKNPTTHDIADLMEGGNAAATHGK